MIGHTAEKALERIENIYILTLLAAKRAVSLCRGTKSLLPEAKNLKPPQIALEEIIQGKTTYHLPEGENEESE